ncbi:type II toxin-antitoxin system PemK/MazF family toxin [bacterium]|nr:MAG: type II toxin-antitoxin system PemK/MazF family toxin [bacterium]
MVKEMSQYEVYWISLDPTQGSEMAKTRPCVIVSPNEMNQFLRTVVVIPITSTIRAYPWRVQCIVSGKQGSVATDQIKVADKARIGSKIGTLSESEIIALKDVLQRMLID